MNSPRVVHLTPAMFGVGGVFGGGERYSFELARHMARVTPTELIAFGDKPRRFTTSDGLRVRVLGPAWYVRGQQHNPIHQGLIRAVAGTDVVHCHQRYTLAAEFAALLAHDRSASLRLQPRWRRLGVLVAGEHRGVVPRTFAYQRVQPTYRRARRPPWYKCDLRRGGHRFFSPDPSVPKEALVVYVGRLMSHKGVNDLIEALPDGLALGADRPAVPRPVSDGSEADRDGKASHVPPRLR